jgi:hypothetical protein
MGLSANADAFLSPFTGVSSLFAKRIHHAGGMIKGQRTPGRCASSGHPAGRVRVRGSTELADVYETWAVIRPTP